MSHANANFGSYLTSDLRDIHTTYAATRRDDDQSGLECYHSRGSMRRLRSDATREPTARAASRDRQTARRFKSKQN